MTSDAAFEAEVLRVGYEFGVVNKTAIAKCADGQIEAAETASMTLIELSMNRNVHPHDMMKHLRKLGVGDNAEQIGIRIGLIGLLYKHGRFSTEKAVRTAWSLVNHPGLAESLMFRLYQLDDAYDLAIGYSYGSMHQVECDLRDFTAPFIECLQKRCHALLSAMNL